ncbi:MAG TPA: hypothetical protein VHN15_12275 [Thermoanaerobaculia bacterium]|nr:hypothetical protein [Thermoanaerobaculia bacterium]
MKKQEKKLKLAKETVRSFEDGLKPVQGGKPPYTDRISDCDTCTYSEWCLVGPDTI